LRLARQHNAKPSALVLYYYEIIKRQIVLYYYEIIKVKNDTEKVGAEAVPAEMIEHGRQNGQQRHV